MIKKIGFFICFCLCITSVYAKDIKYPVDTIALEEALTKIQNTRKGQEQDNIHKPIGFADRCIEEARSELLEWFMSNKKKAISVNDIVAKCDEIVGDASSCIDFLNTYSLYLDHANFCIRANSFKLQNFLKVSGYETTEFTFHDCVGKTVYNAHYGSTSIIGECKSWLGYAQQCSVYLKKYYSQKLSSSKISDSDKKYYECLLDKIQTGNIDFPMSNMEKECKQ